MYKKGLIENIQNLTWEESEINSIYDFFDVVEWTYTSNVNYSECDCQSITYNYINNLYWDNMIIDSNSNIIKSTFKDFKSVKEYCNHLKKLPTKINNNKINKYLKLKLRSFK